jgi:glycine cleavage system H lipoate-binding protein
MPVYSDKNCSDLKCVWMSAGLVKYKLCDLDFKCEHCEFHHAMQGIEHSGTNIHSTHSDSITTCLSENDSLMVNICLNKLLEGCKIHLDRFYHSPHFWLKAEGPDQVQIGIDNLSLKILYPLDRCILPQVGEHIQYGQLMGWLVREEMMIPLYAPVKGEIAAVNPSYPLNISVSTDPSSNDTFLLNMKSKELASDLKQKSYSTEGIINHQQKIACIKTYLQRSMGNQSENIGLTLGDGGTVEQDLEKIMGSKLFREFIHDLFIRK